MSVLTSEDYKEIVANYLGTDNFQILDSLASEDGSYNSFSGNIFKLCLTVVKDGNEEQLISLTFFCKKHPEGSGFQKDYIKTIKVFYKETSLYNTILKELHEILHGKIYPKCYLLKPDQALVLENLTEQKFMKKHGFDTLSEEECLASLTTLARFHSASIIWETKNKKKIGDVFGDLLFEPLFSSETDHPGFHNLCVGINATETIIDAYFNYIPEQVCEKAYNIMRDIPDKLKSSWYDVNVLNHGNLWIGNIMFSYDIDRNVEETRLVDFQCARYSSPILDTLLFIHLTTSHVNRDTEALLVHYYTELGRGLAEADIDINFTWQDVQDTVAKVKPTVLGLTVLYLSIYLLPKSVFNTIIRSGDKFRDFLYNDRSQIVLEVMRTDGIFRKRMSQAIYDLLECAKTIE